MNSEQNEADFFEKLKAAMKSGSLPIEEIPNLTALREKLGINMERGKELFEKAMQSFRPTQPDDLDEKSKNSSHGLAISINTNCFYMEGFASVIDMKFENLSDNTFDFVSVEISGDWLSRSITWCCRNFEPCEQISKMFPVKPFDAGMELIQFRIAAVQSNLKYFFWSETVLPVLEKTKDLKNISIQANEFIKIGNVVSDNAKDMGNSLKVNIENLIRQDKIRDANDLIEEYKKMQQQKDDKFKDFKMLRLELDKERSEQLTTSLTIARYSKQDKRILRPERGSLTETASLQAELADRPLNFILVSKSLITFGRNKKNNDIVVRLLPPSEENDWKSMKISQVHCRINLNDKGVFVIDKDSDNGTLLDSRKIDFKGLLIDESSTEMHLADVLKLSIKHLSLKQGPKGDIYEDALAKHVGNLWKSGTKTGVNSIVLERVNNLGSYDKNGFESYCLVYRMATIGSGKDCSISISDKGLEPVHIAVLYLTDRFYLENLTDLTDVSINDEVISKNELIPLSFGDRIRIARLELLFQQKSQLFIKY